MPSKSEPLISAARLLREAQELVHDVETIVDHCGYPEMVSRLRQLGERLREEFETLRSLSGPKP
jgi:hypothetical protein